VLLIDGCSGLALMLRRYWANFRVETWRSY
jgi:hypothetical protein